MLSFDYTLYQLGALSAIAKAQGQSLQHIKPHGAMYNMAAKDFELSNAIVDAIKDFDDSLILLALSGSKMIDAARAKGIKYASEVFADRAYEADGTFEELKQAVSEKDIEKSFRAAHTLKGVAANLSFNELAKAASELTEQLRPLKEVADTDLYTKVIRRQEKVIKGIETFKQSK